VVTLGDGSTLTIAGVLQGDLGDWVVFV
jgi:hypothetical protein